MMFRDNNYNSIQIQAFLNPDENINLIKSALLSSLYKKIKLQKQKTKTKMKKQM